MDVGPYAYARMYKSVLYQSRVVATLQRLHPTGTVQGGPQEWRVLVPSLVPDAPAPARSLQQVRESLRGPHASGARASYAARLEL